MKQIAVLGSTGSIGTSCLDIVEKHGERLRVVALAARQKWELLAKQATRHKPRWVVINDECVRSKIPRDAFPRETEVLFGEAAVEQISRDPSVEIVVAGIVGAAGLRSTWAALETGKRVAFANKETLVVAGPLVTALAERTGGSLVPVDSEHSAIFQALQAGRRSDLRRVVLTASGGPFRGYTAAQMRDVTPRMAMAHPTWAMGPKVTVDSATMMNKALEMIEAKWLFGLDVDQIGVMIHPQSIVHSFVEFCDGSVVGQLSPPDMRLPIQYALTWPERWEGVSPRVDWSSKMTLDFAPPDLEAFPALGLGYEVARRGGTCGAVLNAANEVAVERFLTGELRFTDIPRLCRSILEAHQFDSSPTLSDLLEMDRWTRGGPRLESRLVNFLAALNPGLIVAAFDVNAYLAKGGSILAVLVGIGLVIFFHELGHFAVAKWCDVFVERFSIGFGPILWSRKYGETEYALSAIPFGGYVKMLGQDDMDPSQLTSEEIARDPRLYSAKSVGQRMAIISAGVSMNVITAVMFYAIAFGHGIVMPPPIVGSLQPGYPAWEVGLRPGDHITSIGGRPTTTFEDIQRAIAFTSGPIEVTGVHANGANFEVQLTPSISAGRRMIGVTPALGLEVIKTRESKEPVADPGSPAAAAKPPFDPGDTIVGLNKQPVSNFTELQHLLAADRSKPVDFLVKREEGSKEPVAILVEPQRFRQLGLTMDIGKITALVNDSPAQRNGIQVGDKILRVNNRSVGNEIDPLRLPDELATLAGREVTVVVQRDVKGADSKNIEIRLIPSDNPGWVERPARDAETPLAAPAIGVAYSVIPAVLNVAPASPADKEGVKKGDRIKKVRFVLPKDMASDVFGKDPIVIDFNPSEQRAAKPNNWAYVFALMQLATDRQVELTLTEANRTVLCTPAVDPKDNWFVPGLRGLRVYPQAMTLKSNGLADAALMGLTHTRNSIIDLYLTLRNLLTGQLSVENLHGPLGIASVAYDFARQGLAEMSLFLGILSANLAVLNFLPIPVLDGGHMIFLIWEGVTRKRPSERVQIAATYFGMAFVLCLALLVFYLDLFVHHVVF